MLIVPDVQDVYTPLESDVIVQLSEVSFSKIFDFDYVNHLIYFFTFHIFLSMSLLVCGNSAANIWSCCLIVFRQCFRVIEPPSQPLVLQSKYVIYCSMILDYSAIVFFSFSEQKCLQERAVAKL